MKSTPAVLRYAVAIALFAVAACQREVSDPNIDPPGPTPVEYINATITGRITDQDNLPVGDAVVKAGSSNTTTDINGVFRIANVRIDKNAGFVKIEKDGFFQGSRTIMVNEGSTNYVSIQLIKKSLSGTVSGSSGGHVTVANGGSIAFTAGSFVNPANSGVYTGTVSVNAFFLDPAASNFQEIMPGTLRGIRTTNEEAGLQSFGMMAVELNGAAGEKLQLATGKTATITFPIPAGLQAQAPATIPLWWFNDTTGLWIEQGTATKQGTNYVGMVSHFSVWNCDYPYPLIEFKAAIKDQNGNAFFPLMVKITTTGDDISSWGYGYTDSSGTVSGKIPKDKILELNIYDKCNTLVKKQNIGPFSNQADLGTITIPGGVYQLTIFGSAINCNATAVTNGFATIELDGFHYRAKIENGSFSISLNRCSNTAATASITAYDLDNTQNGEPVSITVTTGSAAAGQLSACGTSFEQFLNCTLDGAQSSFISPVDSLTMYQQSNRFNIWALGRDSSGVDQVNLVFTATGTGTVPVENISIFNNSSYYVKQSPFNVNITEFGAPGGYVSGNLSTNLKDSANSIPDIPLQMQFRIKRAN